MIDQLLRPTHDLRRCQSLAAARAFRPKTPAIPTTYNIFTLRSCISENDTLDRAWLARLIKNSFFFFSLPQLRSTSINKSLWNSGILLFNVSRASSFQLSSGNSWIRRKVKNTIVKGGRGRKGRREWVPSIRLTGEEKWRLVLGKVWVDEKRHAFLTQSIPSLWIYMHSLIQPFFLFFHCSHTPFPLLAGDNNTDFRIFQLQFLRVIRVTVDKCFIYIFFFLLSFAA